MAWDRVLHKRLRDICAYLWEDSRDARRLVDEAGIDSSRINWDEPPTLRWQSIIMESEKQGTLYKLAPVLLAEYPENTHLIEAVAPWITMTAGNTPTTIVPPEIIKQPTPKVPLVVDSVYADDADEIFVTLESIRADLTFLSKQMDEIRRWRKKVANVAAEDNYGERETLIPVEISLPDSKPNENIPDSPV